MLYKVLPDLQRKYLRIKTNLLLFRFFDSKVLLAGEHKSRSHLLQYFLKNFDHRKKIHWNSFRLLQIHMLLWAEFQFNFRLELLLGFRYLLLLSQNSDRKYFNFAKEVHVRRLHWNQLHYLVVDMNLFKFCCILSSVIFCFSDRSSRWQWNSARISVGLPIIILLKKPVGLFQKL